MPSPCLPRPAVSQGLQPWDAGLQFGSIPVYGEVRCDHLSPGPGPACPGTPSQHPYPL